MKTRMIILIYLSAIIGEFLMLTCSCKKDKNEGNNPAYSTDDLHGTWQMHNLVAGGGISSWSGWGHGLLTIDANGNGTFSNIVKSAGSNNTTDPGTLSISSGGVITINDQNTFHGFMSADKRAMDVTMTDGGGGYSLIEFQKEVSGTNYSTADLQGTWQMHNLVAGGGFSSWNGWGHGLLTVNSSGNGTFSDIVKSDGSNTSTGTVALSISSSGIITISGENTFHGFMSADKRAMNVTMTDGGGGYSIIVFQKEVSGTNYSTADFQGTWQMHNLVAGGGFSSWNGWGHGLLTIDAGGNGTFSDIVKSDGSHNTIDAGTLSISSGGVITVSGQNTFYGFMSADKRAMNITMTDGGGGYSLMVVQRQL